MQDKKADLLCYIYYVASNWVKTYEVYDKTCCVVATHAQQCFPMGDLAIILVQDGVI